MNDSAGAKYLAEIAMEDTQLKAIDGPPVENAAAIRVAAARGGYVLWGVPPFLRMKRQQPGGEPLSLEPLVVADPLLQRMMVGIVVNPSKVKGVSADGASRFLDFVLSPQIQARIAAFRYPDFNQQVWWPAGRHNSARD